LLILDELIGRGAEVSFHDPLIDDLVLENGVVLSSQSVDNVRSYDLVITHTLHAAGRYEWLSSASVVLDATYRLGRLPNSEAL
jgi:UDP-N-acetyl-D-glucosamine dehydrogenase